MATRLARQLFSRSQLTRSRCFFRTAIMEELEEQAVPAAKRARTEDEEPAASPETPSDCTLPSSEVKPRPTRRKCILLLSYSGKGYLGMQRNPGVPTIEEELVAALVKSGAVTEDHGDNFGKMQFQRCARTDKGVSAARQVVSLKMVPETGIEEKINSHLPPQIRVMGMKRVTKSFNCKNKCSARTYEYLLPTYAFAPYRLTTLDYRIDEDTVARVRGLLQLYVGTHNFHNFTSGKKFEEPQSQRYMMSFECGKQFLGHSKCGTCAEGKEAEFMPLKVKGQSFMLHQIRKMIGLVIAVVRGYTPEDTIVRAYEKSKIDIPRAPALGLLLENVHFDGYNRKFAGDGMHESLDWCEFEDKLQVFKMEHIFRSIIDTEINELSMMQWLGSLQIHDFSSTQNRLRKQLEQATANSDPGQPTETSEECQREGSAAVSSSTSCEQGGEMEEEQGGGAERVREGEVVGGDLDTRGDEEDVLLDGGPEEGGSERDGREGCPTDGTHLSPETAVVSSDSQATDINCKDS